MIIFFLHSAAVIGHARGHMKYKVSFYQPITIYQNVMCPNYAITINYYCILYIIGVIGRSRTTSSHLHGKIIDSIWLTFLFGAYTNFFLFDYNSFMRSLLNCVLPKKFPLLRKKQQILVFCFGNKRLAA